MLDRVRLGKEIKRRRKIKSITQKQLAQDICNQSEISRIEAGEFFPSIDVLYLISSRLELPISYFFEVLTFEEITEIRSYKNEVWKLSSKKKYQELYSFLDVLLRKNIDHHPETKKFLLWQKYVSQYYLKMIDATYCLTELNLLLKVKIFGIDPLMDFHIKNSIANILSEKHEYIKSKNIYYEILNKCLEQPNTEKLAIKTHYNLGKILYLTKDFQKSLYHTFKGINLSIESGDMSLLGQFYYQQGSLMEELGYEFNDISNVFSKSYFFFNLLDLEIYTKILKEHKAHYLKI